MFWSALRVSSRNGTTQAFSSDSDRRRNRARGRCVQGSSGWSREVVVRSVLRWVLGTVAVLALAGCGAGTAGGPDGAGAPSGTPTPSGGAVEPADPVGLVGLWTVREAAGEEPGAILRLAEGDLSLWRRCGHLAGSWAASPDGLFVDHLYGGSDACVTGPDSGPAWLTRAARTGCLSTAPAGPASGRCPAAGRRWTRTPRPRRPSRRW